LKTHHRFDYARLAEALAESGLVDQKALKDALQYSVNGGTAFTTALVEANLVTDWELSQVVCDLYGLPFLPLDLVAPDPAAFAGLDLNFLREHALVPLSRFGQVLTLGMPALVEADVLGLLSSQTKLFIIPVVGTVRGNRMWLETHIEPAPALPSTPTGAEDADTGDMATGWSSFFDEADAAVLMDLQSPGDDDGDDPEAS
jgi:MshEN domain